VRFGTAVGEECLLDGTGDSFAKGVEVWWHALLMRPLPAANGAWVMVFRDGTKLGSELVPGDTSGGTWNGLCGGAPVTSDAPGAYRVEIWDATQDRLIAVGTFRRAE
jgi:hypothetical protein